MDAVLNVCRYSLYLTSSTLKTQADITAMVDWALKIKSIYLFV